jgi:hypothetical protein
MTRRWGLALAMLVLACGRKAAPIAPELARPDPAENLAAIATPAGVKLTWLRPVKYSGGQRMNDLAGFDIDRAPGDGGTPTFVEVGTLEVPEQTRFRKERHVEWVDTTATPGARYLYRVRARTLDGSESAPAGPVAVRFGPDPSAETPAAPAKPAPRKPTPKEQPR